MQTVTERFPTELGQLSLLESMGIGYTENGTIPTEIFALSGLKSFETLRSATGTIPTALGQLTGLEYLDVALSFLTGTIPTQLGLLSVLTYLGLVLLTCLCLEVSPSEICSLHRSNGGFVTIRVD